MTDEIICSFVLPVYNTGCGENMSFEDGYDYIYRHIQEEWLRFIYQCGARHVLFEGIWLL